MTGQLAAIGPSLVDIGVTLPDDQFFRFCKKFGVNAGEWREITSSEDFSMLLSELNLTDFDVLLAHDKSPLAMIAGSSTLSMLAALEPETRAEATYISTLASKKGAPTPASSYFLREVAAMGIRHFGPFLEGANPTGLVIAATGDPEKVLLFYPGVARSSHGITFDTVAPDLLIIDAYELQCGELANLLHDVISSKNFKIALSLGNHVIINGETRRKILKHIQSNSIFAIAGNLSEYRALMPEVEMNFQTSLGFRHHPIRQFVPFSLLTMGEAGMVANWRGDSAMVPAIPLAPSDIINTSGAGDAAAGVFFSATLTDRPLMATLTRAAQIASQVLQVPGSLVLG